MSAWAGLWIGLGILGGLVEIAEAVKRVAVAMYEKRKP
jgi:hypothetical protein